MTSMVSLSDTPMNTISNRLYYVSVVAPSVLIGFFNTIYFQSKFKGVGIFGWNMCTLYVHEYDQHYDNPVEK